MTALSSSTFCGSFTLHPAHEWGELFLCDGVTIEDLRRGRENEPVAVLVGKVDTSRWPLP